MRFKATRDRILVKLISEEKEIHSGIELVRLKKKMMRKAVVVNSGPGLKGEPNHVKKGQTILFYFMENCKPYEEDGVEYLVIRRENILMYWVSKSDKPLGVKKQIGIEDVKLIKDYVLIKPDPDNDHVKIAGGQIWIDTSFNPEIHATVTGTVIQVPQRLHNRSKTRMEVEKGDKVYYHYLGMSNANMKGLIFEHENEKYILVEYEQLFFVERSKKYHDTTERKTRFTGENHETVLTRNGITKTFIHSLPNMEAPVRKQVDKWLFEVSREVVMLNGYMLLETVEDETPDEINGVIIPDTVKNEYSQNWGIIRYIGNPKTDEYEEFKVGDKVMLAIYAAIPVEYALHKTFQGGGKTYLRCSGSDIEGILEDEKLGE